jgi:hypothetical protein
MLIVAKLRPDTFPRSDIEHSWSEAVSVLQAHEKFGQSSRRCSVALGILSSKILHDLQGYTLLGAGEGSTAEDPVHSSEPVESAAMRFEDPGVYQELALEDITFDMNDLSYINIHAWEILNQP